MKPDRIERRNRRRLAVIGLLLAAAGTLSACLGAGVFGDARSNQAVFDGTVIRWWNEGGWKSFAVVAAIGLVTIIVGLWLAAPQLRRNDAKSRTPTIVFPPNPLGRGETTLRGPWPQPQPGKRPGPHPRYHQSIGRTVRSLPGHRVTGRPRCQRQR